MIINHVTIVFEATPMCVHPHEALGYIVAPSVINQDIITKFATNLLSLMTGIDLAWLGIACKTKE